MLWSYKHFMLYTDFNRSIEQVPSFFPDVVPSDDKFKCTHRFDCVSVCLPVLHSVQARNYNVDWGNKFVTLRSHQALPLAFAPVFQHVDTGCLLAWFGLIVRANGVYLFASFERQKEHSGVGRLPCHFSQQRRWQSMVIMSTFDGFAALYLLWKSVKRRRGRVWVHQILWRR